MSFLNSSDNQFCKAKKNSQKKDLISSKLQPYAKFCTNCGHQLEADDLFCDECGTKIEYEEVRVKAEDDKQTEEKSVVISSDRMASIIQTNKIKTGESNEILSEHALSTLYSITETNEEKLNQQLKKKEKLLGYYVFKDSFMVQYLIIESIHNTNVKASVKTTFANGGYSTEFYEGSLLGEELHLHIVDSELHPPPAEMIFSFDIPKIVNYTIQLSEKFDGIITENEISGSFSGHYCKSLVFKKY